MFQIWTKRKGNRKDDEDKELKKLYNQILSYCRQYLPNDNAAMECVQEVFTTYFETAAQTDIRKPRAWLYRTADNYLHRYNRDRQREINRNSSLPDSGDEPENRMEENKFSYNPDFDRLIETTSEENFDVEKSVGKVLGHLTQDERKLYDLKYRQRLPIKEIAALSNVSPASIKNRIYRLKLHIIRIVKEIF